MLPFGGPGGYISQLPAPTAPAWAGHAGGQALATKPRLWRLEVVTPESAGLSHCCSKRHPNVGTFAARRVGGQFYATQAIKNKAVMDNKLIPAGDLVLRVTHVGDTVRSCQLATIGPEYAPLYNTHTCFCGDCAAAGSMTPANMLALYPGGPHEIPGFTELPAPFQLFMFDLFVDQSTAANSATRAGLDAKFPHLVGGNNLPPLTCCCLTNFLAERLRVACGRRVDELHGLAPGVGVGGSRGHVDRVRRW